MRVHSESLTFHASLAASNAAGKFGHQYPEGLVILWSKLTRSRCNLILGSMIDE